jgi:hypothetical protein
MLVAAAVQTETLLVALFPESAVLVVEETALYTECLMAQL